MSKFLLMEFEFRRGEEILRSESDLKEKHLQSLFSDVIRNYINGSHDVEVVAKFFHSVHIAGCKGTPTADADSGTLLVGTDQHDSLYVSSVLVDIFWQLDIELMVDDTDPSLNQASASNASQDRALKVASDRTKFIELLRKIIALNFIPLVLLKERLEPELLESVNKFNLLREESEGFSMLETYVTSNLPLPFDNYWHAYKGIMAIDDIAVLRQEHIKERVHIMLENITSLIGYFDLNPNKVLDVLLDIFIANVTDYWDFFISLLTNSNWKGRMVKKIVKQDGKDVEVVDREAGTVCAQILGFKFGYYNHVAPATQSTPPQLFWIASLMIRHKLVRLEDLYPHLWPQDSEVDAEYETYIKKLADECKNAGRYNDSKLADAGALGDDFTTSVKERNEQPLPLAPAPNMQLPDSKPAGRRSNQKAMLASHFLATGDLKHAKFILDRLPKLCSIYPEIADNMSRIMHVVLEPAYKDIRPAAKFTRKSIPAIESVPVNTLYPKNCQVFEKPYYGKKLCPPRYKFFYEPWKENIPMARDLEAAHRSLRAFLPYIGPHLHRDSILLSKICRIGKEHVSKASEDDTIKNSWLTIIAQFIFPALSLTDHNPGLANEIWQLVKLFTYDRRFALYGEWKHRTYDNIPELGVAKAGCIRDAKYIMRRLSKETTKQYGRHIGKLVHSNPGIAFTVILEQIQAYDNQIPFVVDASRYLTDLSFDVLSFCLIEALAVDKERLLPGGTGIRLWLKSLSSFAGNLFRKHTIELHGLLKYMFCQLVRNNVQDLLVLQEVIGQMSGVKPLDDATDVQLEALAGGDTLRRESLFLETARGTRKSSSRLNKAFVESQLAGPFMVILGQHRLECVYREQSGEIKVLGWLQDNIQRSLLQLSDYLAGSCERDAYNKLLPSVIDLCDVAKYRLEPVVAFHIIRPALQHLLKKARDSGDENKMDVDPKDDSALSNGASPFKDYGLENIVFDVSKILPLKGEISKQRGLLDSLQAERSDNHANQIKKKKDRDRCQLMIQQLEKELKIQEENYKVVEERLLGESTKWFHFISAGPELKEFRTDVTEYFIQFCLLPRVLFSPTDAIFCSKFIIRLHSIGTKNFSTIALYDKILHRANLQNLIFTCTELEAKNYGLFLADILHTLTSWHKSKDLYDREGKGEGEGLPGFALRWNPEAQSKDNSNEVVGYETFCKAIFKWHSCIERAFMFCLQSKEYVQIRNSILILDKIREFFPIIQQHGEVLEAIAKNIADSEERPDLKQLGIAYAGRLGNLSKGWIHPKIFKAGRDPRILRDLSPITPVLTAPPILPRPDQATSVPELPIVKERTDKPPEVKEQREVRLKERDTRSPEKRTVEEKRQYETENSRDRDARDTRDHRDSRDGREEKKDRTVKDSVHSTSARESPKRSRTPNTDESPHRPRDRDAQAERVSSRTPNKSANASPERKPDERLREDRRTGESDLRRVDDKERRPENLDVRKGEEKDRRIEDRKADDKDRREDDRRGEVKERKDEDRRGDSKDRRVEDKERRKEKPKDERRPEDLRSERIAERRESEEKKPDMPKDRRSDEVLRSERLQDLRHPSRRDSVRDGNIASSESKDPRETSRTQHLGRDPKQKEDRLQSNGTADIELSKETPKDNSREDSREKGDRREREKEKERDRDRDREKERERERERDKDRERDRERDRDKERDREKDKERERERDRDRNRDYRDRDRERDRENQRSRNGDTRLTAALPRKDLEVKEKRPTTSYELDKEKVNSATSKAPDGSGKDGDKERQKPSIPLTQAGSDKVDSLEAGEVDTSVGGSSTSFVGAARTVSSSNSKDRNILNRLGLKMEFDDNKSTGANAEGSQSSEKTKEKRREGTRDDKRDRDRDRGGRDRGDRGKEKDRERNKDRDRKEGKEREGDKGKDGKDKRRDKEGNDTNSAKDDDRSRKRERDHGSGDREAKRSRTEDALPVDKEPRRSTKVEDTETSNSGGTGKKRHLDDERPDLKSEPPADHSNADSAKRVKINRAILNNIEIQETSPAPTHPLPNNPNSANGNNHVAPYGAQDGGSFAGDRRRDRRSRRH
ncbi:THO complex subunit 2 [Phlyctochytrium planicorne]|nr:THO complex subunit 2 [Phlyctochytrium planicorne]